MVCCNNAVQNRIDVYRTQINLHEKKTGVERSRENGWDGIRI